MCSSNRYTGELEKLVERGEELVGFGALVCQNYIKQWGANEHLQYI